jgi:hypothetical protein
MARYFGLGLDRTRIAYNMERCEEVVLIDAYLKIVSRMALTDNLRVEFDYYFFDKGSGIAADTIDGLNVHLKRIGQPVLEFPETVVFDYGRNPDKVWKASQRAAIRQELESIEPAYRQKMVDHARAEAQRLTPPHRTWEEYREDIERQEEEARLSREAAGREAARQRLLQPAAKPKTLPPETAAALLLATDDEELQDDIITRVQAEQLLVLIDKISDQALKNKVVRRALAQL